MTETTGTLPSRFKPLIVHELTKGFGSRHHLYLVRPELSAPVRKAMGRRSGIVAQFKQHERKWKSETQFFSSPAAIYLHPSYARIIGMGWPAAALILKSLRREPADWFYALRAITGANPVTSSIAGDMTKMSAAWLNWGEQQGLL